MITYVHLDDRAQACRLVRFRARKFSPSTRSAQVVNNFCKITVAVMKRKRSGTETAWKRAHTGRKERNSRHAEKQREKGLAGPRRENENDWEKERRTTVVRGYHELHNSWPFHNGAAPGCGRADGMSFSPFAAEKTILVPILSPHDTLFPLCLPETFSSPRSVPFRASCAVSRLHKVIILRSPRWKKGKGRHKDRTHLETHFERAVASSRN